MSLKTIEKNLAKALLNDGAMRRELYEWEVEEHLVCFQKSLIQDNDDILFVVTEKDNDVAMLLIEKSGAIHINEAARDKLQDLWKDAYAGNMKKLIPEFAKILLQDELAVNGVRLVNTSGH